MRHMEYSDEHDVDDRMCMEDCRVPLLVCEKQMLLVVNCHFELPRQGIRHKIEFGI